MSDELSAILKAASAASSQRIAEQMKLMENFKPDTEPPVVTWSTRPPAADSSRTRPDEKPQTSLAVSSPPVRPNKRVSSGAARLESARGGRVAPVKRKAPSWVTAPPVLNMHRYHLVITDPSAAEEHEWWGRIFPATLPVRVDCQFHLTAHAMDDGTINGLVHTTSTKNYTFQPVIMTFPHLKTANGKIKYRMGVVDSKEEWDEILDRWVDEGSDELYESADFA